VDQTVCPTHLVQDAPASEDAFGAHQRIATAIAQLVETSQGGKCVGLLGTWGAGKSTVVHLLQQQLEQRDSRVVWVFDAWAHEGDSLRRTFLESLIERLTRKKWLEDKAWNERLEYLAGRRKVTEQASRPHLSPLAIVLAITLLFVPIGSSLFDSRLDKGLSLSLSLAPDWPAIAGLFLAFLPLVVLLAYVGDLFVVRRRSAREVRESLRDALTLFVRQTDTAQRTETLESGEPTTLEFERAFFDVMAAALTPASGPGADESRRLVIVIDNLDRVNTEQALAVWSTLQIFVRSRDSREKWLDNLWCVLPFDGDAIRRLWPQDSPDGSNIAESFLDKTFQVRFEVPLPLLSNWKDYLMARLKEAMPSHQDEEFFRVYRLYTVRRQPGALSPTPRELKLFVNQVGSLHRQWQDTIPLPDLAYSVLLQRDGIAITFESIGQFPAPREVGLVSDKIGEHLAALAYGVPGKAAQQLLLREPILQALEAPDPPALKALADSNDAFWLVLEQAVERGCEEWKAAEGGNLLHAAVALEQSGIQEGEPQSRIELLFRRLASAANGVSAWNPMDARAVDGILVLSGRYRWLASALFDYFATARTTDQAWNTGATASAFVEDYLRLASALNLSPAVPVPGPVSVYARFVGEMVTRDREERFWHRFPPQVPSSFVTELATSEFRFDEALVAAVRIAWETSGPTVSWKSFVDAMKPRLRPQPTVHQLAVMHALWDEPNAVEALRLLVVDGVAATQLSDDHVKNDPALSSAWVYTLLRFDEKLTSLSELDRQAPWIRLQLEQAVGEFGERLGQAVLRMGRVETLFTVAREYPMARWAMLQTVDYVARSKPSARVFPPSLLIEQWNDSFGLVGDGFYMAQSIAADNPGLSSALAAQPFRVDRASMYAGALAVENADPALVTLAIDGVQQASENDWTSSFATETGLSRIVEALNARGATVTLGTAAADALSKFIPQLARSMGTQWGNGHRKAVFAALGDEGKGQVTKALFDNLPAAASANRVPQLLTFLGRDWVETGSLSGNPSALSTLITHVLTALNDDWLSSLAGALTATPALVSGLDQAARAEIQSLITRDIEARQTPAAQTALASLATVFASDGPASKASPSA
jgi:hypothetical protein